MLSSSIEILRVSETNIPNITYKNFDFKYAMISPKNHNLLIYRNCVGVFRRKLSGVNLWEADLSHDIKHKIENFWKDKISHSTNGAVSEKKKCYVLSMFPYPSGNLHMGHVRVYTISDAVARFQRMNGKNVIHPIGWDAFGLPAENAAIDHKIAPQEWTKKNISQMKSQLQTLGCSFDWDREITTSDPDYYKWTQYLFLKLYDNGLAYQKNALVNWDPVDQTVLADEQVDENGYSWRSGVKVEKKILKQWFIRTTRFAKDLLDGLNSSSLHDWRDIIKLQQHWIGECNGVNFDFKLINSDEYITLWTPYPEYIHHVKFVAVKKTHYIAQQLSDKLLESCLYLENPFTSERIPLLITDDIDYLQFSDTFTGIPAICEEARNFAMKRNIQFSEVEKLSNTVSIEKVRNSVLDEAKSKGIGGFWNSSKLRDWLISRQRYWGTPIPIIHCVKCGPQPVPTEKLPVELPHLLSHPKKGGLHLKECENWVNTTCPKCKSKAKRETDTMDTFVDSSWYFLRYLDPKNEIEMFDAEKMKAVYPVDLYIGGKEHAVLHLYYARFMSHFLYYLGILPSKEPFHRLLVQGMVKGRSFKLKETGKYLPAEEVVILDNKRNKAVEKQSGAPVVMTWEKMSKSKLNGVEPTDMFKDYGIDTTRLLILADVAPTSHRNWNTNTFPGIINWQKRLWLTMQDFLKHRHNIPTPIPEEQFKECEEYMFDSRNYYIKGTTFNYFISQQLSIAVSKQQGLTNSLRKMPPYVIAKSKQYERALATQIILLAPMAPHFASELWSGFIQAPNHLNDSNEIFWNKPVLEQKWPETDLHYKLELLCKVNGTDKCKIKLQRSILDQLTLEPALELAKKENSLADTFSTRKILGTNLTIHKGTIGILNLIAKNQKEDCSESNGEIEIQEKS
ncbi:hypothetical protein WA026_003663 [Henosepilachna vigintioctopunctata]|uniref:leucine--tRNA ligase n=1 Tax=Henosepilachna vigintioctopunctata TaxID=420089 RepID=A0AAW1U8A2_9CUCU